MKKLLTISILFVMVLAMCTTMVSATTKAELADQLYAIGSKYGATASDKIKVERYLADNDLTDAQATAIVEKANQIAAVMDAAGVTDPKKLTADQKNQIKALANEAASIARVSLVFKNNDVEVYKNGKLVDTQKSPIYTATSGNGTASSSAKLVYTGNNSYIAIALGSVVALAGLVIVGKKVVNA